MDLYRNVLLEASTMHNEDMPIVGSDPDVPGSVEGSGERFLALEHLWFKFVRLEYRSQEATLGAAAGTAAMM